MTRISHQTVRIGKGKHKHPAEGACVMELASMLAGESFTDHPRSVSRSIGALLRTYNDVLDDRRRQDLRAYAAKVVGSAGPAHVEELRRERIVQWGDEMLERRRWAWAARIRRRFGARRTSEPGKAAQNAIAAVGTICDETHAEML